jgi:hypothetical protein
LISIVSLLLFGYSSTLASSDKSPFSEYRVTMKFGRGIVQPANFNADLSRFVQHFPKDEGEWILPVDLELPPVDWMNQLAFDVETNLTERFRLRVSFQFGKSNDATVAEWFWGAVTDGTGYLRRTDAFSTFSALGVIKYYPPIWPQHEILYLGAGAGPGWLGATGSVHYSNIFRGDEQASSFSVLHRYSKTVLVTSLQIGVEYRLLDWGVLFLEVGGLLSDFGRLPGRSSYEVYSAANAAQLSGEYRGDRPDSVDLFEYSQSPSSGYSGGFLEFDMSHYYFRVGLGGQL